MTIDSPTAAGPDAVLAEITTILETVLDEYGLDDVEITRDTLFHDELELESIDLVTLAGGLRETYGDSINFAEFIARFELDEIIALRVGQLVDYVVETLAAGAPADAVSERAAEPVADRTAATVDA